MSPATDPSPPAESERPALRLRGRTLPLGRRTLIMAILNLTDDSFSGDGVGSDLDAAVRRAAQVTAEGADMIDIGAESARADTPVRPAAAEAHLVGEALARIARETDAVLSVDTYKPLVADAALQAGASMINDIGGVKYGKETAELAARYGASIVLNYTYERPKVRPQAPPRYEDVISEHLQFLRARIVDALAAGIARESVVVDPGIAFGKSHDEDLEVLRRLDAFRSLGHPLLVAASRKHFIGSVLGLPPEQRDEATLAITALAIAGGADIVRVHDVRGNVRAARVADAVVRGRLGDYAPTPETWPWAAGAEPIAGTTIRTRS